MNLYLRLLWTWFRAHSKPAIQFGDTIELTLSVLPSDLDVNGHMNNGRYMTITDLALMEYFVRSGIMPVAIRHGWRPMLGGSMISFKRGLKPFKRYTLRFSMQCWDDRWSYFFFEFVYAGQIMASGLSKGAIVGKNGFVSNDEARKAMAIEISSPPFPNAINAWIHADHLIRTEAMCSPTSTHQSLSE